MIPARVQRLLSGGRPSPSDDLLLVVGLMILTNLVGNWAPVSGSPVRAVLGILYVLFLPGYAVVAALFPERPDAPDQVEIEGKAGNVGVLEESVTPKGSHPFRNGIDTLERIGLSFAISIGLVPLIALALSSSSIGFSFQPMLLTINVLIITCMGIAVVRRWRLPVENRFHFSLRWWLQSGWTRLTAPTSNVDVLLNVGVILAILLTVGALGTGMVMPPDNERFTEFYLVNDGNDDNHLTANTSEPVTPDEPVSVRLGIENNEQEPVEYEVVAYLQEVTESENTSTNMGRTELDRFSVSMTDEEAMIAQREFVIPDDSTGTNQQLIFLLYTDEAPDEPTRDNAYRDIYIWIDVDDRST